MASWAKRRPERLDLVGSNASCAATERVENREARAVVTIAPNPMPMTTVMTSVHTLERTERIFVHSERSIPPNPYRRRAGGGSGRSAGGLVAVIRVRSRVRSWPKWAEPDIRHCPRSIRRRPPPACPNESPIGAGQVSGWPLSRRSRQRSCRSPTLTDRL